MRGAFGLVRCGQVRCVRAACARSGPRVPYAARNFLCRVIDSLTTVVRMQPNKPPLGGEVVYRYPPPVPSTRALCLCPLPVPSAGIRPTPVPSARALCLCPPPVLRPTLLPYFTPQVRHNQLELKQVCQLKLKQYENLMCPWSLRG